MSTPASNLETLPLELQQQILSHLPLPTLLTFARTSRHNNHLSTSSLTAIHLAVFPKRIHGILAFLNTSPTFLDDPSLHQIAIPTETPRSKRKAAPGRIHIESTTSPPANTAQQARHTSIHAQNNLLASLLSTTTLHALKSLHINTTAVLSPHLTSVLATSFPHLRHLSLNCSHPYIHEPCLPAKYWTTTPWISDEGTPAWNSLAGIGGPGGENEGRLRLRGLETLEVIRAGMTGRQCLEIVRRNRGLRVLRLGMVTGVDAGFVQALAEHDQDEKVLKVLDLEGCANLELKREEDFGWIEKMVGRGLKDLSLKGCEGVDGEALRRVSADRCWEESGLRMVLPDEGEGETRSCDGDVGSELRERKGAKNVLEVDPEYV